MKIFSSILAFSLFFSSLNAQKSKHYTISGYVREAVTGESVIGANVYLSNHKAGTITNTYGFYSLTLPAADSIELLASFVGFIPAINIISLYSDRELDIILQPEKILDDVLVYADRTEGPLKMNTLTLQPAQIRNVPALLGEKDVLKVLQLMPGIQKGTEGSSGLYVRGGGPDQNLIILDDAIVYNASHLFGFFSLFNGDVLKSVELIKGGFPARYGGRLSSVLEMNMKEGNKEEWHGEGGIGIISSRMTLEGPLAKGKSSILLSGRRTYADLLVYPFMKQDITAYYFYDFNAKINYDFGRNDKLYLSGYFGKDKYYIKTNTNQYRNNSGFLWGNGTATLRWNHLFKNKIFSNTSFIYSNYNFGIFDKFKYATENKDYYAEYFSGIRDFSFKYDLDWRPNPDHSIKTGGITILHRFNPHAFVEENLPNSTHLKNVNYTNGIESGLYIEDTWQPSSTVKINGGLRFSHFISDNNQYKFLEPRLSIAWRLNNDFSFKGSYSKMNQYIHLISNTGISLPTDLWVPTTDRIKPQQSEQIALGLGKDLNKHNLSFSIEGYYKTMNNTLAYKEGATFLTFDDPRAASYINWENNVTAGRSWSYGAEFFIQKKVGRLTGWIGYTLSWTQMQFDSINFGKKYFAKYDRRHDISVIATYKVNNHVTLSGTWVYGTGNAVTLPASKYYVFKNFPESYQQPKIFTGDISTYRGQYVNDLSEKNNFRMGPYHRLDVGIQFHKTKKWGERVWEISVYNVYNRKNPFLYSNEIKTVIDPQTNYPTQVGVLKQISLFPIIPSLTYSFKF